MTKKSDAGRAHVYTRITDRIVEDLESGVRLRMKLWGAANTDGRISRPMRHNGLPCGRLPEAGERRQTSLERRLPADSLSQTRASQPGIERLGPNLGRSHRDLLKEKRLSSLQRSALQQHLERVSLVLSGIDKKRIASGGRAEDMVPVRR